MKCFYFSKKQILIFTFLITFLAISFTSFFYSVFGMQHYYNLDFVTGLVTASSLNVRSGPGTNYPIIANVKKNEYIRVFAGIGNWYVVQVEGDYIGAVSKQYIKPIYPNSSGDNNNSNNNGSNLTSTLTEDEKGVFNLINIQRSKQGLAALKIDDEVQNVARIKAKDMVDNNYFSHNSPIYGSPFEMLNNFKVSYKTAAENIAGNSSNSAAVNAWMNSPGHKANILNNNFHYTGIGVVKSAKYGKVYVQMFLGN